MRLQRWSVVIVGLCLTLGACGSPMATGDGTPSTSTTTRTTTASTPMATATRVAPLPTMANATPTQSTFALFFDTRVCGIGKLDTATETFARKIRYDEPDQIITLVLPARDLAAIRQKITDSDFFDYPEQFAVHPTPGARAARITPAITYTIAVVLDERHKRVIWTDDIRGVTTPEADNLRALISLIEGAVRSTPEYQGMPQRDFGCA